MRAVIASLIAACAISCGQIYSPSGCARPCPASCASSCLPTGYCKTSSWSPPGSPPLTYVINQGVQIGLGDLPPGAPVSLSLHGVFDLFTRNGATPWDYWLRLTRLEGTDHPIVLDLSAFDAVDFPIVADAAPWPAVTDDTGAIALVLVVAECQSRSTYSYSGCMNLLPGTVVTASLLDSRPWEAAPACQ